MQSLIRWIAAAVVICGTVVGAQAQEYRRITLTDGRAFLGEVTGTDASGMTIRTPSGFILIPFETGPNIDPATQADVDGQPPLSILVLPTHTSSATAKQVKETNAFVQERFSAIPHTQISKASALPKDTRTAATACGEDVACLLGSLGGSGHYYAVLPILDRHDAGTRLRLIGLDLYGRKEQARSEVDFVGDMKGYANRTLAASYASIGLTPLAIVPEDAPVVVATNDDDTGTDGDASDDDPPADDDGATDSTGGNTVGVSTSTPVKIQLSDLQRRRKVSIGLGFLPLPGLGSAHLKDPGGVVLNTLFASASGFGLVYLFGAVSPTAVGFYLPAILTTYAAGVLINQASSSTSYRRLKASVAQRRQRPATPVVFVLPTPDGQGTGMHVSTALRW